MRKTLIALAAIALPSVVSADEIRMTCENPRGPYLVVYDSDAKTFVIDPDTKAVSYSVKLAGPISAEGDVGYGSGLTFRAFFGVNPRIRFYSGDKVAQTDVCEPRILDLMGN